VVFVFGLKGDERRGEERGAGVAGTGEGVCAKRSVNGVHYCFTFFVRVDVARFEVIC
jgi:hypothetical protein